ncbi:hypothetical protein KFL_000090155 [Klebsormidium nitens]|uniref:Uncharacterized protein n=1 Tax=Klebsormidium nitens TaxID=105231 RepID=A0A1Y1HME6_KLENI|nr:hypothetical protein KFL_000090155 [Klebsormidium nitens]|eukprot:GAQ78171.1 hypothetical protein KFL_000090155 [Klebsormidium nitens]
MAKGRDVTEDYDVPEGHTIVEILNYQPDASYRGKFDIKHLVIWTFGDYTVHITNAGIPIHHLLSPIIGLSAEDARKRAPRVKAHMEANKQRANDTTIKYQETGGQDTLAVNAIGVDYILHDYICPQIPRERREKFARRYAAMLHNILKRLEMLAGRVIRRLKAGSRNYNDLLLPGPLAQPAKPAGPALVILSRVRPSDMLRLPRPFPPLLNASPQNPLLRMPPAPNLLPPLPPSESPRAPTSDASSPSPPEPKRRRLAGLGEVNGAFSGVVHGAVSAAEADSEASEAGTERKWETKPEGGKKKEGAKLNHCGCSKVDEADFRAYEQEESRVMALSLRLMQSIIEQQPAHERLSFLQELCTRNGYGCNLVRVAPPPQTPLELLHGPLAPVIATLDYVIEHVASVIKEAPIKSAIEAVMQDDTDVRKLYNWKANLSASGEYCFTHDPKRPGKPPVEDTPYGAAPAQLAAPEAVRAAYSQRRALPHQLGLSRRPTVEPEIGPVRVLPSLVVNPRRG